MSGKDDDNEDATLDDQSSEDTLTETVVMSDDNDDLDVSVGDSTVEMDIEKLVAKLEAIDSEDVHRRAEIRHKLEELRELREQELDSTFNLKFDED